MRSSPKILVGRGVNRKIAALSIRLRDGYHPTLPHRTQRDRQGLSDFGLPQGGTKLGDPWPALFYKHPAGAPSSTLGPVRVSLGGREEICDRVVDGRPVYGIDMYTVLLILYS